MLRALIFSLPLIRSAVEACCVKRLTANKTLKRYMCCWFVLGNPLGSVLLVRSWPEFSKWIRNAYVLFCLCNGPVVQIPPELCLFMALLNKSAGQTCLDTGVMVYHPLYQLRNTSFHVKCFVIFSLTKCSSCTVGFGTGALGAGAGGKAGYPTGTGMY